MMSYTTPLIAIVNESSVLSDAEVANAIPAIQHANAYDFRPHWGNTSHIALFEVGTTLPSGAWLCAITDTSDQAGALAYHDIDGRAVPTINVFAKTERDAGYSWTVSLTHELWEALVDPVCVASAQIDSGHLVAYETADPVEDDLIGYTRPGADGKPILLSDFVYPNWFVAGSPGPWDKTHKLTAPLTLAKGGYVSIGTAVQGRINWSQVFAKTDGTHALGALPLSAGEFKRTRPGRIGHYRSAARGNHGHQYHDLFAGRVIGNHVQAT